MQLAEIKRILSELQLAPSKLRGQNFLTCPSGLETIIQFAAIPPGVKIIEVGPGLGALTEQLLPLADELVVVEIDRGFAGYLQNRYQDQPKISVHCRDALEVTFAEFFPESSVTPAYLISNVPYSVSTDLLLWALAERTHFASGCYLLQREFAERVAARPDCKAYGSLSVLFQQYFILTLGPILSGGSFYPPANVESRLLRFVPRVTPLVEVRDALAFERFVRGLFAQRRKTLANNLARMSPDSSKEVLHEAFLRANIDASRRAETLTIQEFAGLFASWELVCGDSFER
jgi:16S rRNA (adenine1518-N6/adenine1519-N6)-dimethyltransferase